MKTATLDYPTYTLRFIDTAPLAARYELLCASIMMFIEAGQIARVLRLTHKVRRLVRAFTQLDRHNILLQRKLNMLSNAAWRERVLQELGGLRKLKLWEAAKKRIEARIEARRETPRKAAPVSEQTPAWLLTPERMAESERLKAHTRLCGRATAHPLILRDRVKMDFDGMFRLAPLPRGERAKRRVKVYTQNTIVDYDWNNIPFAKETGLGPAMVWPAEFYAAMGMERETEDDGENIKNPCIPAKAGTQPPHSGNWIPNQVWDERNKKDGNPSPLIFTRDLNEPTRLDILHPRDVLSPKVTYDLLDSPLS